MYDVCIIGGCPAGLMAAEIAADNKLSVVIVDAMPTYGRKFLMAGKSGLNITKNQNKQDFLRNYYNAEHWLTPIINNFDNVTRNKELYRDFKNQDTFSDRLIFFLLHFAFFLKIYKENNEIGRASCRERV